MESIEANEVEVINFPLYDFPLDHPAMPQVMQLLRTQAPKAVPRRASARTGYCHNNVDAQVQAAGGRRKTGWMIEWVPGLYVQAMCHSVWEKPNLALEDVTTPRPENKSHENLTTYVWDKSLKIDPRWPPSYMNQFLVLSDDPDVHLAVKLFRENADWIAKRIEWAKTVYGMQWTPEKGWAAPFSPTMPDDISEGLQTSFEALHRQRALIHERYFQN